MAAITGIGITGLKRVMPPGRPNCRYSRISGRPADIAKPSRCDPEQTFGSGTPYFLARRFLIAGRFEIMSAEDAISAPPTLLDQSALAPWIDQTVGTVPTP